MKIVVNSDGSVSIDLNDKHYIYTAPIERRWVTEFEFDFDLPDEQKPVITRRKLQ